MGSGHDVCTTLGPVSAGLKGVLEEADPELFLAKVIGKTITERESTRLVLFCDKEYELVLLAWPPDFQSPVHDHGSSCGAVRVLKGNALEQEFAGVESGAERLHRQEFHAGEIVEMVEGHIHSFGNASSSNWMYSLHLYSPPIV